MERLDKYMATTHKIIAQNHSVVTVDCDRKNADEIMDILAWDAELATGYTCTWESYVSDSVPDICERDIDARIGFDQYLLVDKPSGLIIADGSLLDLVYTARYVGVPSDSDVSVRIVNDADLDLGGETYLTKEIESASAETTCPVTAWL